MDEEHRSPGPGQPVHAADPAANPATPVAIKASRSGPLWILLGAILVLVVIIAVAYQVFGIGNAFRDPVVGKWFVGSTGLLMQFDANGTATLLYPDTGNYAVGRWEKVADHRYRLISAKGTKSPPLTYDPIADALHSDDFSLVLARKG